MREFPDLRTESITQEHEKADSHARSGQKNPEEPCLVLFAPHLTVEAVEKRDAAFFHGVHDGVLSAIEGM